MKTKFNNFSIFDEIQKCNIKIELSKKLKYYYKVSEKLFLKFRILWSLFRMVLYFLKH